MKPCICGCGRPARPNGIYYYLCRMIRDGWNEDTAEYEDRLPFDTPVHDEDYASEAMYRASAQRETRAQDEMGRAG